MATVDLNADMGESYGPWKMGNDDILRIPPPGMDEPTGTVGGQLVLARVTAKEVVEDDVPK